MKTRLPMSKGKCNKNASKSTDHRNRGNEAYGRKKAYDALALYNQALHLAPHLSTEFFLALGNRSAALSDLNKLKECVEDIDRVIDAEECVSISKSTLDRLHARRHNAQAQLCQKDGNYAIEAHPQPFLGSNCHAPSLSKAVDVCFSAEKGRHFIANTKLEKGSVVVVEEPFAKVLLPHCARSHCHFCCRELPLNYLPCTMCVEEVRYCNEQCRDVAWTKFHSIECGNVEKLGNIGLGHLAVRTVLYTPIDQLIEYNLDDERVKSMQRVFGSRSTELYSSPDFSSVASLESHDDDGVTASSDDLQLTAVKLTRFLRENDYFSARQWPARLSDEEGDEIVIRTLIGLVRRLICNAHAVTRVVDSAPVSTDDEQSQDVLDCNEVYIASGIFPTTSLANHSCIPNMFSSFVCGTTVIVRVTRDVNAGDELFNCYGPMFGRQSTKDRQDALLQQYGFVCKCNGCTSPQSEKIEREMISFCCPNCTEAAAVETISGRPVARCCQCQHSFAVNFTEIMSLNESLEQLTAASDLPRAEMERMLKQLTTLESHLYRNNKRLGEMRDSVARVLAIFGYDLEAVSLLRRNSSTIAHHYGAESIESAEEMTKLSHHLRRCITLGLNAPEDGCDFEEELRQLIAKARSIFAVFYGWGSVKDEQLKGLEEKE